MKTLFLSLAIILLTTRSVTGWLLHQLQIMRDGTTDCGFSHSAVNRKLN